MGPVLSRFPLAPAPAHQLRRILHSLGPVFIHLAHLGSGILLFTGLGPAAALWGLALYLVRMLATPAIYHRLIAHGSHEAPRLVW